MTQPLWTAEEIITATSGKCRHENWGANSLSIDSRSLEKEALFVALKGEHVDGHVFVAKAVANGAAAALVEYEPEGVSADFPLVVVPDVEKALQALGVAARARSRAHIVAVTGSVGKTTTKEMFKLAMSTRGSAYATRGNYNNHLGVPLSLCSMPRDTDYAVLELGMNHAGEIAQMVRWVRPHAAVITNVEAVHLEHFENVEGIAAAKAEIMQAIEPNGFVFLPRDNPYYNQLANSAEACGVSHCLTFGEHLEADIRLCDYDAKAIAMIEIEGEDYHLALNATGKHLISNALAVLGWVKCSGGDVVTAIKALETYAPVSGRGNVISVNMPQAKALIVDDSYNASPASMKASFQMAKKLRDVQSGAGRLIVVLGDMLELGPESKALHASLAEPLRAVRANKIYLTGVSMLALAEALTDDMAVMHFADKRSLAAALIADISDGDVILIKGSRGSRMDEVISAVTTASQSAGMVHAL